MLTDHVNVKLISTNVWFLV